MVALFRAAQALDGVEAEGDELTGVRIVCRALEEPLRRIATTMPQSRWMLRYIDFIIRTNTVPPESVE